MMVKRFKRSLLAAVAMTTVIGGSATFLSLGASAATPDGGTSSAYGVEVQLLGATLVPQTPLETLGAAGQSASASSVSLPISPVVTANALTAAVSSTNFGTASEVIVATAGVAGNFSIDGVKLLNALAIQAITTSCAAAAIGSAGSADILSVGGATSALPIDDVLPSSALGPLSGLISVELNAEAINDVPGSAAIAVDGLKITVLSTAAVVTAGVSECTATGSDILPVPAGVPTITGIVPSSGPIAGGAPNVTISGTNLENATSVTFGSTPATIVVDGATQLTVTPPAGAAGPATVTVTTPGGSVSTTYTYTASTTPTIYQFGISPTSGPLAGGTLITISGTNLTGTTGVTFGGVAGTTVTVVSPNEVTVLTPPSATAQSVLVVLTTPAGSATAPQEYTYVSAVVTPPTVVGISPTSGPPGGGETVTIGGTNLCGATAVDFGPTPATITSISSDCTTVTVTEPPGTGTVPVTITTPGGTTASPIDFTYIGPGYWEAAADGGVFSFGGAKFFGSVPSVLGPGPRLNSPIVTMADTPDHAGYWLFAADGGVFSFGDAKFFGSVPGVLGPENRTLNGPIVAAQASPDGLGYRMFAADGGVFDFGDALFTGSLPGSHVIPPSPITAAASAPIGQGYWLVSSNGGVYSYGAADPNVGSAAGKFFGKVVALGATPTGLGLYLFLQGGAVAVLGDALSGLGGGGATSPIVFGEDTSTGKGYWEFSANGTVSSFGDAPNLGSSAGIPLAAPITSGIAFGAKS